MSSSRCLLLFTPLVYYITAVSDFNPFSDSIPYTIKWSGPLKIDEVNKCVL